MDRDHIFVFIGLESGVDHRRGIIAQINMFLSIVGGNSVPLPAGVFIANFRIVRVLGIIINKVPNILLTVRVNFRFLRDNTEYIFHRKNLDGEPLGAPRRMGAFIVRFKIHDLLV